MGLRAGGFIVGRIPDRQQGLSICTYAVSNDLQMLCMTYT